MISLDDRIEIKNIKLGENTPTFRQFRDLNDILTHIELFQKKFNIERNSFSGSPAGIMHQFMCFHLPIKYRDYDDVCIYFMEDDPQSTLYEPFIQTNMLWVNKKTRKVLDGAPDWFLKKIKYTSRWN